MSSERGWTKPVAVGAGLLLGAGVAVLSYEHALIVARWWGAAGPTAYLVPLLGDGLIVVCSAALYEAAQAQAARPWQARAGLWLGIAVTVALNVASGWQHGWASRCLNGLSPVALLVAIEVLMVMFKRGRGATPPPGAPATPDQCPHGVAMSAEEAGRLAHEHARECLGSPVSQRQLSATFGVPRARVAELVAAQSQNGDGPHE